MGNQTPEQEEKLKNDVRADFDKVDTDKSGMIEYNEFRTLFQKVANKLVGKDANEDDIQKTFNKFDKNGDGKISFDEVYADWASFGVLVGIAKK